MVDTCGVSLSLLQTRLLSALSTILVCVYCWGEGLLERNGGGRVHVSSALQTKLFLQKLWQVLLPPTMLIMMTF